MDGEQVKTGKKRHATQILTGVIIIVALLVIAYLLGGVSPNRETVKEIAPGQELTTAPKGKIIADFPKELLLEDNPTVQNSFSVEYADNGSKQPAVTYISEMTLEENVKMFGDFLKENEWNITQDANEQDGMVKFFYAKRDNADVNVTFVEGDGGMVEVTIAYLKR